MKLLALALVLWTTFNPSAHLSGAYDPIVDLTVTGANEGAFELMECSTQVNCGVSPQVPVSDAQGIWKAVFVGPLEDRPSMVSEMEFEFSVDGHEVTGTAHIGEWPGDAPISEGRIDGTRISFTVNGRSPWWSKSSTASLSGYPKLKFTGIVKGNDMKLLLNWGNVVDGVENGRVITAEDRRAIRDLEMEATRTRR